MVWKEFLTATLAAHGRKVGTSKMAGAPAADNWALEGGSLLTVTVGPLSLEFRADGGYLIQVQDEYLWVGREKPVHEATYIFYSHVSAFRLQKAEMSAEDRDEGPSFRRAWD